VSSLQCDLQPRYLEPAYCAPKIADIVDPNDIRVRGVLSVGHPLQENAWTRQINPEAGGALPVSDLDRPNWTGKFVKATSNLSRDRIELKFPITGAETMEMHDLCSPYQGFDEANVARARQEDERGSVNALIV
jgi:hypothetical protein